MDTNKTNSDDLNKIVKAAAELFDFRLAQFSVIVQGNEKLKEALMKYDFAYYQTNIVRLNQLEGSTKRFERAKLYSILGLTQEELWSMCDKMEDMYNR